MAARAHLIVVLVLVASSSAFAQMQSRPTDAPLVNAAGESWYQLREPLAIGGDLYYPAGASVFFNGNVMVRTGHYNGVPLYVDATLEPYSVLYVPIGRGQMQPYERPRRGALAGSAGSRLSAFPVRLTGDPGATGRDAAVLPMTAVSPTQVPVSLGAMVSFTPEWPRLVAIPARSAGPDAGPDAGPGAGPDVTPVAVRASEPFAFTAQIIVTSRQAESNDGLWVQYENERWVSGGRAESRTADFAQVGTYGAFPVLRRSGGPADVIYLPTRGGLVAPYRRKG